MKLSLKHQRLTETVAIGYVSGIVKVPMLVGDQTMLKSTPINSVLFGLVSY